MAGRLPEWDDYLAELRTASDLMPLLRERDDPALAQEAQRLFFLSLAAGYFTAFADPDLPDFVPTVNTALNASLTNPDFVYYSAQIDGAGSYRLCGERGDVLFSLIDITAGGLGVTQQPGRSLATIDLDTLAIDPEGRFDLILAAERPAGWAGDWRRLDPSAQSVVVRQAAYHWGEGRDGRFAIERLDKPLRPRRRSPEEVGERLMALAGYPRRYAGLWLDVVRGQRERGLVNRLEHDDWAGRGGVPGQHYYQGLFRLQPGEALLLETALPERVRYWNVQLGDPVWNTIDWLNRQGSLNGGQARLDADGRFRAVIALEDPGVPNWLDPGGWSEGAIMLRWLEASDAVTPSLRPVPVAALREMLPHDTPHVTPDEREQALRRRRRGVQFRRRW